MILYPWNENLYSKREEVYFQSSYCDYLETSNSDVDPFGFEVEILPKSARVMQCMRIGADGKSWPGYSVGL